jgi:CheY-like chemotaxis protein
MAEVPLDEAAYRRALNNLIVNALKYGTDGRWLGVSVTTATGENGAPEVQVAVSDRGRGIDPAVLPHIFEAFYRGAEAKERQIHGNGLGLSLVKGIAEAHGGRVTVKSTPGAGATFTVELPLGGAPAAPVEPREAAAPPTALRVLVIDDEPHILYYMRATLEAWGHEVVVAPDGEEGLGLALAREFDVIITDLRMPRLGGRELFERLYREAPALVSRLVFSTGDAIRGDTLVFLEERGRPCLHKPFSLAELRGVLAEVAGGAGAGTPAK